MRLCHYQLIKYLPNSQLIAQWRELNSIFKKQDKHILINYIYDYKEVDLAIYSFKVIKEMYKRNINIKSFKNLINYFKEDFLKEFEKEIPIELLDRYIYFNGKNIFQYHHNNRYLKQCFYNLQEKYDRGQKDFSEEQYLKLLRFVKNYLGDIYD